MKKALIFVPFYRKTQKLVPFGDPYGTRTHDTTVKGWCLNRLTKGPVYKVFGSGGRTRTNDLPGMNRPL